MVEIWRRKCKTAAMSKGQISGLARALRRSNRIRYSASMAGVGIEFPFLGNTMPLSESSDVDVATGESLGRTSMMESSE